MGDWKISEKAMGVVCIVLIALWSTKPFHGLSTTLVAWIGVSLLILTRTLSWDDIIKNNSAWDTLVWLGGLLAMANNLKDKGFIDWFAANMQVVVSNFQGITVVIILALIYFYSMYGFSMLTGHISALVGIFFGVALVVEAPGLLVVPLLAYFSNLCGCTTNYSTGPVIIYIGLGYVPAQTWFKVGFLMSIFHTVIWMGAGMAWWKILGWW